MARRVLNALDSGCPKCQGMEMERSFPEMDGMRERGNIKGFPVEFFMITGTGCLAGRLRRVLYGLYARAVDACPLYFACVKVFLCVLVSNLKQLILLPRA